MVIAARLLRTASLCTSVIGLAALLGGCSGSDGGNQTVYISMSNYDGCSEAYVSMSLDEARAELARKVGGGVDCTLNPDLASAGCAIRFTESNQGSNLDVKIDGCRVGLVADLFSCEFVKVDVDALNLEEVAGCGCLTELSSCYVNRICDVCAITSPDRRGCEDCTNLMDDDGDREIDCHDPDCDLTQDCGFGRTTITCSTTTTTSTSLPSSTLVSASDLAGGDAGFTPLRGPAR